MRRILVAALGALLFTLIFAESASAQRAWGYRGGGWGAQPVGIRGGFYGRPFANRGWGYRGAGWGRRTAGWRPGWGWRRPWGWGVGAAAVGAGLVAGSYYGGYPYASGYPAYGSGYGYPSYGYGYSSCGCGSGGYGYGSGGYGYPPGYSGWGY